MSAPRIAVIGYDPRGAALAAALAPAGALRLIAEPDATARARARADHPSVHVTGHLEGALEPEAFDAVLVVDPAHIDLVHQAASAGIVACLLPAGGDDPVAPLRQLLGLTLGGPRHVGIDPDAFVHATVAVQGDVKIGAGTKIWHFSKLLGPLSIGERCIMGQNVVVERHVEVGNNVKIQNNVSVYSGVILEDDVFCGPSMVFTNVGTPRSAWPRRGQYLTTRVCQGASIGANATIVCGNQLGRYCFVGAGAVVTKPVPDYGLVYGNPARLRGWACFCGVRLTMGIDTRTSESDTCSACGRHYRREGLEVREVEAP